MSNCRLPVETPRRLGPDAPGSRPTKDRRAWRAPAPHRAAGRIAWLFAALVLCACETTAPPPVVAAAAPPVPAPAPPPPAPTVAEASPDPATAADHVARRLLAYHERLAQMSALELTADITRLDAEVAHTSSAAAPDVVLDLAVALAQQHGPGDLERASGLLEAITQAQSADMEPWQPMARLLAGAIAEQRRLEDQLEQQAAQRRDSQRAIQQLTEKLEALKAIERSMNTRSAGGSRLGGAEAPAPGTRQP